MDSCRHRTGEAGKPFPHSHRPRLSDARNGGPAGDGDRCHPERRRGRAELRDRQGSLPRAGLGWCARQVARRARRDRAERRRTDDDEDSEHAGSGGIGEAGPDRRNAGASDPGSGSTVAMSTENREQVPAAEAVFEEASRNTLALNPLVGIRGQDLVDSAGVLFKAVVNEPKVAAEQWCSFLGELGAIVAGKSERAPQAGDKRFSDATWKGSTLHSGMLKAYLAWGDAVSGFVDKTSLSDIDKARAHLVTEILIDGCR